MIYYTGPVPCDRMRNYYYYTGRKGFGRYHFAEKIQFYNIAKGSTLEVQNHLIEAMNNGYIIADAQANFSERYHIVEVKLNNLISSTAKARKKYATKRSR